MLIYNVTIVNEGHSGLGYVVTDGAFISAVGSGDVPPQLLDSHRADAIDGGGDMLLPGAIDCHVHFREPGMTHKATIASESRAAAAGGVTSYIDMPNTRPATTTRALLDQKADIAAATSMVNYGFMLGATIDNIDELLLADYSRVAAVKVFMGSSTGGMLVDDDSALRPIFSQVEAPIVVHAEDNATIARNAAAVRARLGAAPDADVPVMWHSVVRDAEACVRATDHAITLAQHYGSRLHVAHLSTAQETHFFDPATADDPSARITAEVSPHHLMWCSDDYASRGARIKMNPAVKSAADRDALRKGLADGRISIIATDHAPHLLAEKQGGAFKAVSGAPLVQFSLPAVLSLFSAETAVARMCHTPARLFGIHKRGYIRPGYYADMVIVKRQAHTVADSDVLSLCGWSPLDGVTLQYQVSTTIVNGRVAYRDGVMADSSAAMALTYHNV